RRGAGAQARDEDGELREGRHRGRVARAARSARAGGDGEQRCLDHGGAGRGRQAPRRERSRAAEGGEAIAQDRREGPVQAVRTTTSAVLLSLALAALAAPSEARANEGKPQPAAGKADEASQHFKSGVA